MTKAGSPLRQLKTVVTEAWIDTADLRTLFSVLYALRLNDPGAVPGSFLAHALRRLMACEVQPGGPYRLPDGAVDAGANRMIARFLQLYDVVLPALRVYADGPAVVSPAGLSTADKRLLLLAARATVWSAPGQSAGPARPDGSGIRARVLANAHRRMQMLPEPLRTTGLTVWDEMRRADSNHEITRMPQLFAEQLLKPASVTDHQLLLLGEANFFCWIATILYDDFIDEEGEPARLPIANVAYRISLQLYRRALAHTPRRYTYVERMYNAVDRANAWEVMHTRVQVEDGVITIGALPRYGSRMVLADRAFGHVIGPMLLVQQLPGVRPRQMRLAQWALQHYLIARQLNDDIHDWRKDLRAGQLSAVVTDMLQALRIRPGRYDLEVLVARLEQYFLRRGLERQCLRLIGHVQACRQAMTASGLTRPAGGFMRLVDDLEASAKAALQIQADEQAFLQTYQQLASATS